MRKKASAQVAEASAPLTSRASGDWAEQRAASIRRRDKRSEAVEPFPKLTEIQKFGQKVVAVVSSDESNLNADELVNFARSHLSGYKLPKEVIFVDEVKRAPNGKANYKWAKETADKYMQSL